MLDTNKYPETECDITLDRTGCTTNLQIFPQGSSGARVQMQGTHYAQATQIAEPELRNIFAGPERDYANYMFNVVVEHTCTVVRVVKRYARPGAGEQRVLETLVFVERKPMEVGKKPIIDLIRIPTYIQNHQTFAVELELTDVGKRLGAKKLLKKGTVLAQTKSVIDDEYCVGLHANTLLVSHPMVIEDSCLISQDLADRMMSYGYKTYRMTIGDKDFPLLLYKDKRGNPSLFPEVGEKVRDDGILFAKREYDPLLAAVEMSESALSEPCGHFDDCTFVNPDSEVIDIKVHRDDNRPRRIDPRTGENLPCEKMSTPVGMQEMCDTYADAYSNFQGHVRSLYRDIKSKYRSGRSGKDINVDYSPDAKQAIMYAIADNPKDIDTSLPRYTKQFGQLKNDDYMIEITVKFPIPLSVSGKITDTMGGKGIVGQIVPTEQMPIDEFGNRVDLMMSENAMLRRTNFNRGFENYVNAARRDAEIRIIDMYENGDIDAAWDYLIGFTGAVNPEWSYAIEEAHPNKEDRIDLLDAMAEGEEKLRLWVPSDNRYPMDQIERNVRNDYPPRKSKLKITMEDGSIEYTKSEFSIGELYMIRLDKWGGEFSAVAAGRFQAFGTIAKQHSSDKHRRPVRENPIKHIGESEVRHQQAYIGGDVCADAHDRSNNPAVADNVIMSILSADVPSNIDHAVDRKKHPLGHNRVMEINRHVLRCDGIGFTTRRLK